MLRGVVNDLESLEDSSLEFKVRLQTLERLHLVCENANFQVSSFPGHELNLSILAVGLSTAIYEEHDHQDAKDDNQGKNPVPLFFNFHNVYSVDGVVVHSFGTLS